MAAMIFQAFVPDAHTMLVCIICQGRVVLYSDISRNCCFYPSPSTALHDRVREGGRKRVHKQQQKLSPHASTASAERAENLLDHRKVLHPVVIASF